MSENKLTPLIFLGIAVGAMWWFYCQEDEKPVRRKTDAVWSDIGFNPYAWWQHEQDNAGAYQHPYPARAGEKCLPHVGPNEAGSLSTTELEVGSVWDG